MTTLVTVVLAEPWSGYSPDSTLTVGVQIPTYAEAAALVGNGQARWGSGGPPVVNTAGFETAGLSVATRASMELAPTAIKTSNYTAAVNDWVPVDATAASRTVTLPAAPADRSRIGVKAVKLGTGKTVSIAAAGADVFNKAGGSATLTLSEVDQAMVLQYDAADAIWYVLDDSISLAALQTAIAAGYAPITDTRANSSDNYTGKSNGALPALSDAGETRTAGGQHGTLAIVSGKGVATPDGVSPAFLYDNITHTGDVQGAFATWTYPSSGTLGGTMGLHAWNAAYLGIGTGAKARVHWGVGPTGMWAFRVIGAKSDGTTVLSNAITGQCTPPAADGVTVWSAGWLIDPKTGDVYLRLPDYTFAKITAAQIAASAAAVGIVTNDQDVRNLPGPISAFEWFQNATTDLLPSEISREIFTDNTSPAFTQRLREAKLLSAVGFPQPGVRNASLDLGVPASTSPTSGDWNTSEVTTTWGNESFSNTAPAIGDSASYWVDLSIGTYALTLFCAKFSSYGIWKLEISGDGGTTWTTLSAAIDLYNASLLPSRIGVGFAITKAQPYLIRLTCTGKNASSSNYSCSWTRAVFQRTA